MDSAGVPGQRPFRDAIVGEKLLVPMSDSMRAETRELFAQLLSRLDQGVDFETLCREFTEAEDLGNIIENLPFGNYPTQPEILAAGRTLPVGEVSGIIETDHGFEVIQVIKRTDENMSEFEEVAEPIKDKLRTTKFFEELERIKAESLALLVIDAKTLLDPKASLDQTAITLGERRWTVGQAFAFPGMRDELLMLENEKQIREKLSKHAAIFGAAREAYARQKGFLEGENYRVKEEYNEIGIVAQEFIKLKQAEAAAEISEDDLLNYYNENLEQYSPPNLFVVRQIVKGLNPEADLKNPEQRAAAEKEALEALRKGVKGVRSTARFIAVARALSDDTQSAAKEGLVGQVPASYKPGTFSDVMNSLEARTISEPFIYGNLAYVIWTDEIVNPPPTSFEKVKLGIKQRLEAETRAAVAQESIEDALESVGTLTGEIEIPVPDIPEPSTIVLLAIGLLAFSGRRTQR